MYVCKYDGKTPLFSEWRNFKWQYSGCSMVCIDKCFAPWKSKKRKTNTHSAILDPALWDTQSCQYHCWVLVHVCVCGWTDMKLRRPPFGPPRPHVQVWTMSTKVNFGTRDTADVPLFCGCSCTFLSSECVNLYTWCENSSINVYQENGTKTKNVTF